MFYFFCFYDDLRLFAKENIQSNKIAPTVAVIRFPIILDVAIPNNPKIHPPIIPPTIPITRLSIRPNPPPRITCPAMKPATIPIRIYHRKFII